MRGFEPPRGKAWRQLCREGADVARCTVARLMAGMGLRGAVRGKAVKTTIPDTSVPCPRDKVNRQFRAPAPNMLWVSDFTYVSTWQGFAYVAFVIDTLPTVLWVGKYRGQRKRTSFWTRLNRHFMCVGRFIRVV